jgi:hypothetical protein
VDEYEKDLSPRHQLNVAQIIRKPGMERSRREFQMYRQGLNRLQLGTPALYVFRWEPHRGLYWLLLEQACPKRLSRLGDIGFWLAAALSTC